jgi:hypothetical protein
MLLSLNGENNEKIHITEIDQNMNKLEIQDEVERLLITQALPQTRHYKLSSTMREVAELADLEILDLKADNSGENYVVLRSGPIQMGRIGVNQGSAIPREAKHRALIAALNARLEGYTHDLFSPTLHMLPSSTLGILLLNVNPKANLDQDRMIDLQVGVPYSDLSGWHYRKSCSDLISRYSDLPVPQDAVQPIDKAVVRLKEVLNDIEEAELRDRK